MNSKELREALKDLGWSQATLAGKVGLHPNSISKMVAKDKVSRPVAAYLAMVKRVKGLGEWIV